jgi:NAD(P)-dependent dehydrogenase (short-subunit alcohol dehydrogenase family)
MDLGLAGKVALVTAASRGIGRGIAEELAREGAQLSICARGKDDLEATAAERMAIDLADDGIVVNTVCPALIQTPLWDRLADSMVPVVGTDRTTSSTTWPRG